MDGDRVVGLQTLPAGMSAGPGRPIACGYFAFAHSIALVRGITRARGSFIGGILDYSKSHPLHVAPIESWYDFGHVQTFFRSRRVVTSARHFNAMRIDGRTARKSSAETAKINAEADWLAIVPPALRIYTARLIDAGTEADGTAFYETEYNYLPSLSELFVYGALGVSVWAQILRSCQEFLTACRLAQAPDAAGPPASRTGRWQDRGTFAPVCLRIGFQRERHAAV